MDIDDRSEADWASVGGVAQTPRIGRRSVLRRLAGQWWRIVTLWFLASAPVACLIYAFVEPTYEAVSLLRADPTTPDLYGPGLRAAPDPATDRIYLLSQVKLITSNSVLDAALGNPAIGVLPMIRASRDPKSTLREEMRVEIVGQSTYLLEVALASKDPVAAAAIVNAVVKAYMDQHADYHQKANRSLRESLRNEQEKLSVHIHEKEYELTRLAERGRIRPPGLELAGPPAEKGEAKGAVDPSLRAVTEPQIQQMSSRLIQADFDLIDARARVDAARLAKVPADRIQALESAVVEAEMRRSRYKQYIAGLQVASRTSDSVRASLLEQDLAYLRRLRETVTSKLNQLDFEIGQVAYKVTVQDKAPVPTTPKDNRRLRLIGAAPVVILFLVIGLFLVREVRASRRDAADPAA
jgi:uncharacterized protein involved in exopolysaccharide biosynthesis